MTADREALKRDLQDAIDGDSERVWEYLTPALVLSLLAELEAAGQLRNEASARYDGMYEHLERMAQAERDLISERDQLLQIESELRELLGICRAERDQLRADNGRLCGRTQELVEQSNELYAEVVRLRTALEAVAVSKFATEPRRIARDALESISPAKS